MVIIAPHPTEELCLIKYQKELVRKLFTPDTLIYAHQPLWIGTKFKSVQEAKKLIKGVTIYTPEYDIKEEGVFCPVKITTTDGDCLESKVKFIHGLPRRYAPRNDGAVSAPRNDGTVHTNDNLFPLPLKIFRLGECYSPSPGIYELNNIDWKKVAL